jgi:hypothetical protein
MSVSGHNGNNETFIGVSNSMGLTLYDENSNEIPIRKTSVPFDIVLQRDSNLPEYSYYYVNASTLTFSSSQFYLTNTFKITAKNASMHIELKPLNNQSNIGYILVIKLASTPLINSTHADYTWFKIFCPNQTTNDEFRFFKNMSQVNGFKGFVGYSIRELNSNETDFYCIAPNNKQNLFPLIQTQVNFTSDFLVRAYTSGCYYYDVNTGKWQSDGMEIYEDSDLTKTHCASNHLTSFAGGLVVLPQTINFQHVFANASFTKNPFIYVTVIVVTCVYILFALWAKFMDMRDRKRSIIVLLKDSHPLDDYFYELKVFTGNRSESGTRSKVIMSLSQIFF